MQDSNYKNHKCTKADSKKALCLEKRVYLCCMEKLVENS